MYIEYRFHLRHGASPLNHTPFMFRVEEAGPLYHLLRLISLITSQGYTSTIFNTFGLHRHINSHREQSRLFSLHTRVTYPPSNIPRTYPLSNIPLPRTYPSLEHPLPRTYLSLEHTPPSNIPTSLIDGIRLKNDRDMIPHVRSHFPSPAATTVFKGMTLSVMPLSLPGWPWLYNTR